MSDTPENTKKDAIGRRILREAIPLTIFATVAGLGLFSSIPYTLAVLGGLLGAVVRMLMRTQNSATVPPRFHWFYTILVTGTCGAVFSFLLAGWARSWKAFAIQVVLAPLPIAMGMVYTAQSLHPEGDIAKANDELAQIHAHPELLAEEIAYFTRGFDKNDLVYFDPGDDLTEMRESFNNEQWLLSISELGWRPFALLSPPHAMTFTKRIVRVRPSDRFAVFMSPEAIKAGTARKDKIAVSQTGMTMSELFASGDLANRADDLDFPYYPAISMVRCDFNDESGTLIGVDAPMAGYHLDVLQVEAFKPLVEMCQKVADGTSLDDFPRTFEESSFALQN